MDIETGQETRQRTRACDGNPPVENAIRQTDLESVLERMELLKHRIVRMANNHDEGLELYQEVWLLLLRRGSQLNDFANNSTRILCVARRLRHRRRRRRETECVQLQAYRRTILESASTNHCLSPFEALDAAEALHHCWHVLEEPWRQIIRATLTVQGPIREQACAVGMCRSIFLHRKRYLLRAVVKLIKAQFPCMLNEGPDR